MARFQWVKEGITGVDGTTDMQAWLAITTVKAGLVLDSPLTFDWTWTVGDLTLSATTGLTPVDIHADWTGPWYDNENMCLYRKNPSVTWTNGGVVAVTVTGVQVYDSDEGGKMRGVIVFDDEIVLNPGDALEVDIFAGIGTCNPDAIVTTMDA